MKRWHKLKARLQAWLWQALGVITGTTGPLRCGTRTGAMNGYKR